MGFLSADARPKYDHPFHTSAQKYKRKTLRNAKSYYGNHRPKNKFM